jgi:hypothetical protein
MLQQLAESSPFCRYPFSWAACVFTVHMQERGISLPCKHGAFSRVHAGAQFYTWCLLTEARLGAVRDGGQRHLVEGGRAGVVCDRGP